MIGNQTTANLMNSTQQQQLHVTGQQQAQQQQNQFMNQQQVSDLKLSIWSEQREINWIF